MGDATAVRLADIEEVTRRRVGRASLAIMAMLVSVGPLSAQDRDPQPDSSLTEWIAQATRHMADDEWREAVTVWSRVVTADSTHVVAYLNRAMSHFRAGDCAAREADARHALSLLDGDRVPLPELERLVYRAQAHGHLLEFGAAIDLLEAAAELDPSSRPVEIVLRLTHRRANGEFDWECRRP